MHPTRCAACAECGVSPITDQRVPMCGGCQAVKPPKPPPMRQPMELMAPGIGSLLVVLVFVAGMAVGAKMAGGW